MFRGRLRRISQAFHPKFVRENTWDTWDASSRQRLAFNIPAGVSVKPLREGELAGGRKFVDVQCSDGHVGRFEVPKPAKEIWDKDLPNAGRQRWGCSPSAARSAEGVSRLLAKGGSLRFRCDDLYASPEARARWIEAMHVHGISVVEGLPVDPDTVTSFAVRMVGYVVPTMYGSTFSIVAKEQANNLAYSALALQQHTDLPFCTTPPSVQLFHCLQKAREGGANSFLDGFDAAASLHAEDPEAFRVLCRRAVRFQDVTRTWHFTARHPTFALKEGASAEDGAAGLHRVCFNERARDSWRDYRGSSEEAAAISDQAFYDALEKFERLVEQRGRYARLLLEPGEMVCVDNWRVMHSRESFVGARHLEGAYIDWDALFAAWRAHKAEADIIA